MTNGCVYFFLEYVINMINIFDKNINLFSDGLTSPTFAPAKLKFPKHIHNPTDDKFQEIADSMLRRKTDGPELHYKSSAPYEIDEYPIEENESKNYFERQLSTR